MILAIALIARLAALLYIFHIKSLAHITFWGNEDVAIALSVHEGHGYSSPFGIPSGPTALLAPGYPLLIAAVMHLFGTGASATVMLLAFQTLLSILTLPLLMWVARSYFGVRAANLAGLIFAIGGPMVIAPTYIWETCLSALLLTGAVALAPLVRWTRWQSIAIGFGCAIAILVNPSLLAVLFAVFTWSAFRTRVFPWLSILVFLIAFSPWPIRNLIVMRSFIPLRSSFGYELWMGNHPGGDGNLAGSPCPENDPAEAHLLQSNGEVGYVKIKGSLAREFIAAHPAEFSHLTAKRFVRFWTPDPIMVIVALLGIAGLSLLRRQRWLFALFALPLAIFPLPYYITHVEVRYQFVIDPLLAILAGFACESFLAWLARRPLPAANLMLADHEPASAPELARIAQPRIRRLA